MFVFQKFGNEIADNSKIRAVIVENLYSPNSGRKKKIAKNLYFQLKIEKNVSSTSQEQHTPFCRKAAWVPVQRRSRNEEREYFLV